MYATILTLHVLAATIWTGGHLVLATIILPRALKEHSVPIIAEFESRYERIGIPALIIQVLTGLHLAAMHVPDMGRWFSFSDTASSVVGVKLILLAATAMFAVDARLRLIPKLTEDKLVSLAWHVIPVTIISVLFVIVGVSFRTGGIL